MSATVRWSPRARLLRILRAAAVSGSLASAFSTLALLICGKRDTGEAATTLNGPAQWIFGKHAAYQNGFRLRYTPVGLAIHHACSMFWALGFETFGARRAPADAKAALSAAAATALVAYVVDYHVTPDRFRPGFEKRLRPDSLVTVYAAFALGLAAARYFGARRRAAARRAG